MRGIGGRPVAVDPGRSASTRTIVGVILDHRRIQIAIGGHSLAAERKTIAPARILYRSVSRKLRETAALEAGLAVQTVTKIVLRVDFDDAAELAAELRRIVG